jgi:hypothetical protein
MEKEQVRALEDAQTCGDRHEVIMYWGEDCPLCSARVSLKSALGIIHDIAKDIKDYRTAKKNG